MRQVVENIEIICMEMSKFTEKVNIINLST